MIALIAAVFTASLLGSLHCAGMCGAFVAFAVGLDGPARPRWRRRAAPRSAAAAVTAMAGDMCRAAGLRAVVAGNIGLPVLDALAQIEARLDGKEFEIAWPNVLRVDTVLRPVLTVDWDRMEPLPIDPAQVPLRSDIAPAIGGAPPAATAPPPHSASVAKAEPVA